MLVFLGETPGVRPLRKNPRKSIKIVIKNKILGVKYIMSIIKSHNITLYGKTKDYYITLCPLCDDHLPLLYKWNADPVILYWMDGGEIDLDNIDTQPQNVNTEAIGNMYGNVSQNAYCFLIKVNDIPIGECWLQKMNFQEVIAHYPNLDIRRIDMMIGEKDWWNKGIGTAFVGMLTDFAFVNEKVDIVFNFPADYNIRSKKVFEKNGYKPTTSVIFDDPKENESYHCILTKEDYKPCLTYESVNKVM